jgi:hypothetical protein
VKHAIFMSGIKKTCKNVGVVEIIIPKAWLVAHRQKDYRNSSMFLKIIRSPPAGGERGSAVSLAYCTELEPSAIVLPSPREGNDGIGTGGARKPVVLGEKKPAPKSGDPGASRTKM